MAFFLSNSIDREVYGQREGDGMWFLGYGLHLRPRMPQPVSTLPTADIFISTPTGVSIN